MKRYDEYDVAISSVGKTSFDDGTWFYTASITWNDDEIYEIRMIANDLSDAGKFLDEIIKKDMDGVDALPHINELNPYLANWIHSCWSSDNDMWYVDPDADELQSMTYADWKEIRQQVKDYFADTVEICDPDEAALYDDYVVCCYGSCINNVNWI